jgi:hypothetical protein
MNYLTKQRLVIVVGALVLTPAVSSRAQPAPPPAPAPYPYSYPYPPPPPHPEEVVTKRVGLGYKIGNGMGFVGGDVIIAPVDHLTFDLQANWVSVSSGGERATGYGLAPGAQFHFNAGSVSSAYIGLGYLYATLSLNGVTASGQGGFFNAGYNWQWSSGLGILLGGGVGYLASVRATDGVSTVERKGGAVPNLEFGLRYMFM